MTTAHVRINGISFANNKDKPNSVYGIRVENTRNGISSRLLKFKYSESKNLRFKISLKVLNKQHQTFKIFVYKIGTFRDKLFASTIVPVMAFPENNVCHEKLVCTMEDQKLIPISVMFDLHLDTKHTNSYNAPCGRSTLEIFDSNNYYNLQIMNENRPTEDYRESPLLI